MKINLPAVPNYLLFLSLFFIIINLFKVGFFKANELIKATQNTALTIVYFSRVPNKFLTVLYRLINQFFPSVTVPYYSIRSFFSKIIHKSL